MKSQSIICLLRKEYVLLRAACGTITDQWKWQRSFIIQDGRVVIERQCGVTSQHSTQRDRPNHRNKARADLRHSSARYVVCKLPFCPALMNLCIGAYLLSRFLFSLQPVLRNRQSLEKNWKFPQMDNLKQTKNHCVRNAREICWDHSIWLRVLSVIIRLFLT